MYLRFLINKLVIGYVYLNSFDPNLVLGGGGLFGPITPWHFWLKKMILLELIDQIDLS